MNHSVSLIKSSDGIFVFMKFYTKLFLNYNYHGTHDIV